MRRFNFICLAYCLNTGCLPINELPSYLAEVNDYPIVGTIEKVETQKQPTIVFGGATGACSDCTRFEELNDLKSNRYKLDDVFKDRNESFDLDMQENIDAINRIAADTKLTGDQQAGLAEMRIRAQGTLDAETFRQRNGSVKGDTFNTDLLPNEYASTAAERLENRQAMYGLYTSRDFPKDEFDSRGLRGPSTRSWNAAETTDLRENNVDPTGSQRLGFPYANGYTGSVDLNGEYDVNGRKYTVTKGWTPYNGKIFSGGSDTKFDETGQLQQFQDDLAEINGRNRGTAASRPATRSNSSITGKGQASAVTTSNSASASAVATGAGSSATANAVSNPIPEGQ